MLLQDKKNPNNSMTTKVICKLISNNNINVSRWYSHVIILLCKSLSLDT